MSSTIAAARKRKKLREKIGISAMLIILVGVVTLASWFEYELFRQFYEPLGSIILIITAWVGTGVLFYFALTRWSNGTNN